MNDTNCKIIHTNLYSQIAYDVIDSMFGQLSDGLYENSPAMEKWWKFATADKATDGEVIIKVDSESCHVYRWSCPYRYVNNGFYGMADDEVKTKVAKWIKHVMQVELKDNNVANGWKRTNTEFNTRYLNRRTDICVAEVYCIYEKLLGRNVGNKYSTAVLSSVNGSKRSPEETAAEETRRANEAAKVSKYNADSKAIDDWEKAEIEKIKAEAKAKKAKIWAEFQAA